MNDNKSRDIFYGVVAIATLIVAIVGATLAYFSISTSSDEGAVSAKSKVVSINYNDKQQVTAQATQLIPSELSIMQYFYELQLASGEFATTDGVHEVNKCQDINNQEICSVYRFSVGIDSGRENITATLRTEDNGFNYLAYAVRDVSCTPNKKVTVTESADTTTSYDEFSGSNYNDYTSCWMNLESSSKMIPLDRCLNTNEDGAQSCYTVDSNTNEKTYATSNPNTMNSLFGYDYDDNNNNKTPKTQLLEGNTKIYDVVLFLAENRNEQNKDQGKEYHGTLIVEVAGGESIITGKATNN